MATNSPKLRRIIFIALAISLIGGGYVFLHRNEQSTDDAAIDGHAVVISPKVPGYVKTLAINDNQLVKQGDLLLEIDPADYIIRRDRASAMLDGAKAEVSQAEAVATNASGDLKRVKNLSKQARSEEQVDKAISDDKSAQATLERLQAQVKQATADLAQAEKDLADTKITAPIDGFITKRGVERGNYIQPGQQLMALVGKDIWVTANFKETQIKNIKIGDKVDIHVDAFPGEKIVGKVDSIQLGTGTFFSAFPPENATGNFVKIVQRVPVKISLDEQNADLHLGLGMSVVPTVHTNSSND